ncbi:MAG: hypothetical protein JNL21_14205 [Myxococcales bacterium]|nr:hypothetical protein [Myxococcales bacterium]
MTSGEAQILTHGYCFDGLVSAALATHLVRQLHREVTRFGYRSCGYGPRLKQIPQAWLGGAVNVLCDFRYVESPRLSYYFDHHATAFASRGEETAARERVARSKGARHLVFDPTYGSCAKLMADTMRETFGVDMRHLTDLVAWADKVDAARFDDPEEAFFARAPALVLADVAEHHGSSAYVGQLAPRLLAHPLEALAASEDVRALASPIAEEKARYLALVRQAGKRFGDVVLVDLAESGARPAGKFATYVAFPDCTYSVALLRTQDQLKVGVGYNPWSGKPRRHDVAALCKREGGGGHAVVGAATFAFADIDRARQAAHRIVEQLGR